MQLANFNAQNETINTIALRDMVNEARRNAGETEIRNNDFIERVEDELEGELGVYEKFVNAKGAPPSKGYTITLEQATLVAMRESKAVRRAVVAKLKEQQQRLQDGAHSPLDKQLAIANAAAQMLRLPDSGKLLMLTKVAELNGVSPAFLPGYAIDAPPSAGGGSSMATQSLTELLKSHKVNLSAKAANALLMAAGLLCEMSRPSSSGEAKAFKSVTEAGMEYGKNVVSPHNQRETQPHWYVHKFGELLALIGVGA